MLAVKLVCVGKLKEAYWRDAVAEYEKRLRPLCKWELIELPEARLVLQVHDELIVECPPEEREQVERILQEEMEGAVRLSVPMVAEAGSGRTWFEAKE